MKLSITATLALALTGLAVATPAPKSRTEPFEIHARSIGKDATQGAPTLESVIHRRVARHIRPDYSPVALQKRDTLGPATDLGGVEEFNQSYTPRPVRGNKGSPFLNPSNEPIDYENPDYLAPPPTDAGTVSNLKWSFSLSKTRLLKGGWVREQTVTDLPSSKEISAAEQSLSPYAYRELHWHRVSEWAYVINGTVRITVTDQDSRNYVSDVPQGDIWYFPRGVPHSLQAGPEGAQYLLIFDDGDFDAQGTTFMLDDWVAHTPRDVLIENFGWNSSVFDTVPTPDPYIVAAPSWPTLDEAREVVTGNPAGEVPNPYHYELSKQEPTQAPGGGGYVKISDYRNFTIAETIASALVHVSPGALRELHWHRNVEWGYIISGRGRATAFAGSASARTFDLQGGDSWVFPTNYGHYIQNVDESEPLVYLEVFRAPNFGDKVQYEDFSLTQWLRLTPPEVAARNLNVSESLIRELKQQKQVLVGGSSGSK